MSDHASRIDRYLDDDPDPNLIVSIDHWLAKDPANVLRFAKAAMLHAELRDAYQASQAASPFLGESVSGVDAPKFGVTEARTTPQKSIPIYLPGCEPKPSRFRPHHYAIAIAAVLLVAGIAVAIVSVVAEQNRQREIEQQKAELAERIAKRPVATLIESTGKLNTPHGYPAEGSSYGRGEYTLDSGKAEFMLTNAVNVKLRGDTRMVMHNDMNVVLVRGTAAFVAPKDAKGFTVHLPDRSKVVDLGTAFRVEVDGDGRSKLHVTEGLVEWIGEDPAVDPMRLEAGAVVRIARGQATPLQQSSPIAGLVHEGLSVHYRADDVDGFGAPGDETTTRFVNLADPERHVGVLVNSAGIVRNTDQLGTPFEYGIVLNATKQTHIKTDYQIAGGVDKVADATWEFWLRADRGVKKNRGALYGEFPTGTRNGTRHYLRLEGIETDRRTALYDEFVPTGGQAASDASLYDTGAFTQVVVTKRGDTMTFYRDGAAVGSTKNHSETYSGPGVNETLFGKRVGQNESFDGQFNIIRVYDSALTAEQIKANYEAELAAAESRLGDEPDPQNDPLTSENETADR